MAESSGFVFEQRLRSNVNYVKQHEDKIAQTLALSLLPYDKLVKETLAIKDWPFDPAIRIIVPLAEWYKNEFFKWMDQPDCLSCKAPTTEAYHPSGLDANLAKPTPEEKAGLANRIELFKCGVCQRLERFPRFNNPATLLETRRGRCGEWANCFYLFLRALELKARFVVDWTDHVWCEVYSKSTRQWIHVDPCEAAVDKPLLYEAGWGKKLSYVIAFSNCEVTDVTWRYVVNRKQTAQLRTEVSEKVLVTVLRNLNRMHQQRMTAEEKNEMAKMHILELADMLQQRKVGKGEDIGRQSGSAQWRLARGEAKASDVSGDVVGSVIRPTEQEAAQRYLVLTYNCALDKYERDNKTSVGGWESLVWKSNNIFRKVERDWKMAYLCRNEGSKDSDIGSISWFLDLKDSSANMSFSSIELDINCETFAAGAVISLKIYSSEDTSAKPIFEAALNKNGSAKLVKGEHYKERLQSALVTITMNGGTGHLAWQHAQLFRQSLMTDRQNPAMQLKCEFCD